MHAATSLKRLTLTGALVAALAAAPANAAPAAEYVPFVTDFPKPAERYVPFVSDFPRPTATPTGEPTSGPGFAAWDDVPSEAVGTAVAAVLAGAALALLRRRHDRPPLADC